MAENQTETAVKSKTEYTTVTMPGGREVKFAGKRKVNKETLIDESKIEISGDVIQFTEGAVSVRMDFRNGETRTLPLPVSLLAKFAGHGGEQKFGDELASPADKPMSEDDMVLAIDALYDIIKGGKWGAGRAEGGGGVAGAGIVVKALMEVTNKRRVLAGKEAKPLEFFKEYLQKRLDASEAADGDKKLTRRALYDSFRADPAILAVIKRMEAEEAAKKEAKAPAIDVKDAMEGLEAA